MKYLSLMSLIFLSACTTHAVSTTNEPMEPYDSQSFYNVQMLKNGFKINVRAEKFFYKQDALAMMALCKNYVAKIASEESIKLNKNVQIPQDKEIFASFGYNALSGDTTCTAQAFIKFAKN